jgi:uncharacterized membrane protein
MTEPPPGGYPPPQPPQSGGYQPPQPPQSGGYQPPAAPQGGGYPPPPPPHSGGSPPPPQGGGYPPPGGGYPPAAGPGYGGYGAYGAGQRYDAIEGLKWAWNKFVKYAGPLIVATVVYALISAAVQFLTSFVQAATNPNTTYTSYDNGFAFTSSLSVIGIITSIIGSLVVLVVLAVIQSAYVAGLLDIANGREVSFGSFYQPRNVGSVLVAGVLVGLMEAVGLVLCIFPFFIVLFFMMFWVIALVDRNLSPIDAITTSFNIVKDNFVNALLVALVAVLLVAAGSLACGVGLVVALPVLGLFAVYSYRLFTGGQVAPVTP